MTSAAAPGTSTASRLIRAPRERVWAAFIDPDRLAAWLAPGEMTGVVHAFDPRVGGGYEMSLFYPQSAGGAPGKTAEREDRFRARFVEIAPPSRMVQAIRFDSGDAAFAGEMRMIVTLEARGGGTEVTVAFAGIPAGIRPEDNETGTRESLEKLARLCERAGA